MEHTHTPEPWKRGEFGGIFPNQGGPAIGFFQHKEGDRRENSDNNERRVIAAVNACAGIPTELLEEGIIKKAMADFEMMWVENGRMKMRIEVLELEKAGLISMVDTSKSIGQLINEMELKDKREKLDTGYTPTEQNCKGCFGPCGMCEEPEIGRLKQLKSSIYKALEEWNKTTNYKNFVDAVRVALINEHQAPKYFIGTENGIQDIDELPGGVIGGDNAWEEVAKKEMREITIPTYENPEPDYDNQAKDYEEDQRWSNTPTPYDP